MDEIPIRALYIGAAVVLIGSSFAGAIFAPRRGRPWSHGAALGLALSFGFLVGAVGVLLVAFELPSVIAIPLIVAFFIVWVGSVAAGAILARWQGRSPWFGLALGLGLNLVGVLIVALLPADRSMLLLLRLSLSSRVALPRLEMEVGKCRSCGAGLHSMDRFCSQCGTPVASPPQGSP